jgi:hypothetical protein
MPDFEERPAQPEQPDEGGFDEGQTTLPKDETVGRFSVGQEEEPHDPHEEGRFSEGEETLPPDDEQGRFSTGLEEGDPDAPSRRDD